MEGDDVAASAQKAAATEYVLIRTRQDMADSVVNVLRALLQRDRAERLTGHNDPCLGPYRHDALNLVLYYAQVRDLRLHVALEPDGDELLQTPNG